MNLLNDAWMPVRCRDGSHIWIAPNRLSDPNLVAFDAPRSDFNGALAQFAIGLLQTTSPADSPMAWKKIFDDPPAQETLRQWFTPVAKAFELDGDGARFMQDFSLRPGDGKWKEIGALLIEAPGENTIQENKDHFVKRGGVSGLCWRCAATALLTLQVNAPSGGQGHLTGVRGGGPLTTLVICHPRQALWHDLWLNVRERPVFLSEGGGAFNGPDYLLFPWLAEIEQIQPRGRSTAPIQVHPGHVYWAMPRRIRLDFEDLSAGICDICGGAESQRLVRRYIAKPHGIDYKGPWDHPLSPYYESKSGWLPFHPQPGGIGYRHWLAWIAGSSGGGGKQRRARVVDHVLSRRHRQIHGQLRLWAFGYDMENMKARCWYESTLPLYELAECQPAAQRRAEAEVGCWLAAAEIACFQLRSAIREAWFQREARGDFSCVDVAFWGRTEPHFYSQLEKLIDAIRHGTDPNSMTMREGWHHHLVQAATTLFDEDFVGAGQVEGGNPRRVANAFRKLRTSLYGTKIRHALGLPPLERSGRKEPSGVMA